METVPYLGETIRRWRVGSSTFLACPERGARLMHWQVEHGDGSVRDIVHWPEDATLANIASVRGGNPILFPFSARTFADGVIHRWRGPEGVVRPMPMHGIARQGKFELAHIHARGFTALLQPDADAQAAYPYRYEFTVTYRFEPLSLTCEFTLRNLDARPLPWSAGHHFYFAVPWRENTARGDYSMRFPARETLRQDARGQLVPGPALRAEEPLDNPAIRDVFHLGLASPVATLAERDGPGRVAVRLGTADKPAPDATFVTWTLDDTAPFFCLEPWMGPANAPEHGRGLHHVAPGQAQTFAVEVEIA